MKNTDDNEKREILVRVLAYLKPYKVQFLQAGFILIISTVIGLLQPLVIQWLTDDGMLQQNIRTILQAAVILALLVIINQSIDLWQAKLFAHIHKDTFYSIFHQAYEKLLHLKKNYFEDKNSAEIVNFLDFDVFQVSSVTERYIAMSVSHIFRIISGLIGLFLISWKLALIVLAMVPVKFVLVHIFSKRREKSMNEYIESCQDFSRWFGDDLNGVDEIKLWNLFQEREALFKEKQGKKLELDKKGTMIDAWNNFWERLIEWGVTILLYITGGMLICAGELSIGAVFAFVSYSSYVIGPVSSLINLKMYFAQIFPSAKRLFQFLDMDMEEDTGTTRLMRFPPRLEFQNVEFSYAEGRTILQGVDFYVEPGEKVAIIGPNGSGKSTILNLLLRFYEPGKGKILQDGIDVRSVPLDNYRELFSVVSQDPYLFLGSILENADPAGRASKEGVEAALVKSGVADYLPNMPDGGNTLIGRNGARLSGGEKQKLAMARAILKNAPILILDEATSSCDVESDAYLHDVLVNQTAGKSVIMITHHYENLEGMDRVYRLRDGKLEQQTILTKRTD